MPTVEKFLFDREFGIVKTSNSIYSDDSDTFENTDDKTAAKSDLPIKIKPNDDLEDGADNNSVDLQEVEEILEPTYNDSELTLAKDEAYEKGKIEGMEIVSKKFEQKIVDALIKIEEQLIENTEKLEILNLENLRESVAIAASISKKLFPTLESTVALQEVKQLISNVLKLCAEEPNVKITVHNNLVEGLQKELKPIMDNTKYYGNIDLVGDDKLGVSDCSIDWSKGGATRNTDSLSTEINKVIDKHLNDKLELIKSGINTKLKESDSCATAEKSNFLNSEDKKKFDSSAVLENEQNTNDSESKNLDAGDADPRETKLPAGAQNNADNSDLAPVGQNHNVSNSDDPKLSNVSLNTHSHKNTTEYIHETQPDDHSGEKPHSSKNEDSAKLVQKQNAVLEKTHDAINTKSIKSERGEDEAAS